MNFLPKSIKLIGEVQTALSKSHRFYSSKSVAAAAAPSAGALTVEAPKKKRPLEAAEEELVANKGSYKLDRWTDWKMKKDYLRRQMIVRKGRQRMLMTTIHENDILPLELREIAAKEVDENLPRDSGVTRLCRRCAITSHGRSCVEPWRVSRHFFRLMADYNKLAGVQRGIW